MELSSNSSPSLDAISPSIELPTPLLPIALEGNIFTKSQLDTIGYCYNNDQTLPYVTLRDLQEISNNNNNNTDSLGELDERLVCIRAASKWMRSMFGELCLGHSI